MSDAENLRELAAVLATVLAQSKATRITAQRGSAYPLIGGPTTPPTREEMFTDG